nr:MAG TPA: Oligosaccaryltransferase [Caudoviricetes sp.]
MITDAQLFILCTAIVFITIALFGFDICFKDKVKLFIVLEIFLALLIIGSIVC